MTETDGDHSEELHTEEIARQHPSAEAPEQAAGEDREHVADRDGAQSAEHVAERDSDAGEDYAGSGF